MKKLICTRLTRMSNGNDVTMLTDVHLSIVDGHGNVEVELEG